MLKKVSDFYQTAAVNDLQCVAYAYRPLAIEMDQDSAKFDPSIFEFVTLPARALPEAEDGQLESSSKHETILEQQKARYPEKAAMTSALLQTDHQDIAISSLQDHANVVIDVGGVGDGGCDAQQYGAPLDEAAVTLARVETGPLTRWRKLREMYQKENPDQDQGDQDQDHGQEYDPLQANEDEEEMGPQAPVNSQEFFEEAVQGQIFLGMTTLAHQPKTVRAYRDRTLVFDGMPLSRLQIHSYVKNQPSSVWE